MRSSLNTINRLIEAWLDVHYKLVCHLDSRSREKDVELKIPRSIAYVLLTPSNRWRSRVLNLQEPPGAKTVTYIWRSRDQDCNAATKFHHVTSPPSATSWLPSLAPLHCARQLYHHLKKKKFVLTTEWLFWFLGLFCYQRRERTTTLV